MFGVLIWNRFVKSPSETRIRGFIDVRRSDFLIIRKARKRELLFRSVDRVVTFKCRYWSKLGVQ